MNTPDPDINDHPSRRPTWQHDGAVVKEQSDPRVFLLFDNARFHIGSPDELVALGLSWDRVVTVPDGALATFDRVPDRGALLRDRSVAEVWLSLGDRLCCIPTPDAQRLLGLGSAQAHVVPTGSLDGLPQHRLESASATPSSMVFAPDRPRHWPRSEVPGLTLPNGSHVVEICGWLRAVGGPSATDPDWPLQLEPDPAWLDQLGVDWTTIFKVGDILNMGLDPLTNDADQHARVATPTFHIECNGWQLDKHVGVAPPADWYVGPYNGGQLQGVFWPYLPSVSGGRPDVGAPGLGDGQYVRVVGSLVHDIAHCHGQGGGFWEFWEHNFGIGPGSGAYNSAAQDWEGQLSELDQADPARHTEIHPPDLIEIMDQRPRRESVYGVVVVARAALANPFGHDQAVTVDLRPPAPRPPGGIAAIAEFVGPETRFGSIVEGNSTRTGAAITLFDDRAQIHVKVHADGLAGAPGKFKAVYRMSWAPDPRRFVPDVRTESKDQASKDVSAADLVPVFNGADVPGAWVSSQHPTGGTRVLAGSAVTLHLTVATNAVLVPDVREMWAADADQAIRDAGLVPKSIGATSASSAWVLSQTPAAGSLVSLGSTVVINLTDAYRP